MEYGPDGAFAVDLADDAKAEAFLKANGLEAGQVPLLHPALRFTPYWTIPEKKAAKDETKHARNEAMKDHDGKPLLDAIVKVIEEHRSEDLALPGRQNADGRRQGDALRQAAGRREGPRRLA
jgi:hypothetical protein